MCKRLIVFLLLLGVLPHVQAQCGLNIALQRLVEQQPDLEISLFIRGDSRAEQAVHQQGGTVNYRAGKYFSARIAAGKLPILAQQQGVMRLDYQLGRPTVLNDSNRVVNNVDSAFFGFGALPFPLTGQNVVMGIIDGGIDFNHGDFKNPDGSTRVLRLWNQFEPFDAGRTPPKYGYGQVWDSTDINAGTASVTGQYLDHGCTVAGTAAGNANENGFHRGVAPLSPLVVVSSDFYRPNWLQSVADAVDYIVTVADSLGMPCVINASLGDYLGSHDGLDPAALYIDSLLLAKPGRIMVAAGGNSGNTGRYHLEYTVTADTAFTWFRNNASMALGPGVFMEIWADTADLVNTRFAVAVDKVNPNYQRRGRSAFFLPSDCEGSIARDTIYNTAGDTLAFVEFYSERRDGQYLYQVYIPEPDTGSSDYRFALLSTGSGHFDLWGASWLGLNNMDTVIPTPAQFPPIVHYRAPDDRKIIVGSWACSPNVITVANYMGNQDYLDFNNNYQNMGGQEGKISKNSSYGPSRTGLTKPDIGATGDLTLSAGSLGLLASYQGTGPNLLSQGGMHVRNGGTSMASPVVAGTAALYLQKCPWGTPSGFWEAITQTANHDVFSGVAPNDTFGYGKLNAYRALLYTNFSPTVLADTVVCSPGSAVSLPNSPYPLVIWNDTDTAASATATGDTTFWFLAQSTLGCRAYSDTVSVNAFVPPFDTLYYSDSVDQAQPWIIWLEVDPKGALNYAFIDTLTGDTVQNGPSAWFAAPLSHVFAEYVCVITYSNGCTTTTNGQPVYYWGIDDPSAPDIQVYPNPATGSFRLVGTNAPQHVALHDAQGRVVARWHAQSEYILPATLQSGLYYLQVDTHSGKQVLPLQVAR
jgi:hypothetical protein